MIEQIYNYFTTEMLYLWVNIGVLPFWLMIIFFPQSQLCKYLANRYNEFSSIVICLYANNQVGKNLAKGINKFVSVSQQKQFWLAMYTNNSVEGEYFDSNPSSYLGNY